MQKCACICIFAIKTHLAVWQMPVQLHELNVKTQSWKCTCPSKDIFHLDYTINIPNNGLILHTHAHTRIYKYLHVMRLLFV